MLSHFVRVQFIGFYRRTYKQNQKRAADKKQAAKKAADDVAKKLA